MMMMMMAKALIMSPCICRCLLAHIITHSPPLARVRKHTGVILFFDSALLAMVFNAHSPSFCTSARLSPPALVGLNMHSLPAVVLGDRSILVYSCTHIGARLTANAVLLPLTCTHEQPPSL
jgi:hypothetical protein